VTGATKGRGAERPQPVLKADNPEWKRATCPRCGSDVVSNAYRIGGVGYRIFHECVGFLEWPERTCSYRAEMLPNGELRKLDGVDDRQQDR
jgi:hypothetical protein